MCCALWGFVVEHFLACCILNADSQEISLAYTELITRLEHFTSLFLFRNFIIHTYAVSYRLWFNFKVRIVDRPEDGPEKGLKHVIH
jgi:hypothetical protein